MAENKGLTRRQFIAASTATVLGTAITKQDSVDLEVDIYQTEELADRAQLVHDNRGYPAQILQGFAAEALKPLIDSTDIDSIKVNYRPELEPSLDEEAAESTLKRWRRTIEDGNAASLLLTDRKYHDSVGVAERTNNPTEATVSVLGEGYDFLDIDRDEDFQEVLVGEYELEELGYEINYSPFKTVVAGIHEIGHNLGLEHDDGEVFEHEEGAALSVMAASYLDQYMESGEIRFSDDVYWARSFSENATETIDGLLD